MFLSFCDFLKIVSCGAKHVGVGIILIIVEFPYTLSILLVGLLKVTFERFIFHCSVIPLYQREKKNVSRSSEKC